MPAPFSIDQARELLANIDPEDSAHVEGRDFYAQTWGIDILENVRRLVSSDPAEALDAMQQLQDHAAGMARWTAHIVEQRLMPGPRFTARQTARAVEAVFARG